MKLAANDPSALLHMRCRSEGSCALIMAWYHPELYHRVLTIPEHLSTSSGLPTHERRTVPGCFTSISFPKTRQAATNLAGSWRPRSAESERNAR